MSIALLVPTKGRPEQFKRMCKSAKMTASNVGGLTIFAATSQEDLPKYDPGVLGGGGYIFADENGWEMPSDGIGGNIIITPDGMPTAYKWNLLAEKAMQNPNNKLFMLCADDVIFSTPMWDKALLDHYNALENKIHVYHLLDNRTGHGTPHPIVTREYIEAMGYFLHPLFLHWFVDTWTVEIAKAAGCFTHMTDYMLEHIKPSDQGKPDATHTGIRAMGWHERDVWTHEHSQHILDLEKRRLLKHFSPSAKAVA